LVLRQHRRDFQDRNIISDLTSFAHLNYSIQENSVVHEQWVQQYGPTIKYKAFQVSTTFDVLDVVCLFFRGTAYTRSTLAL
jgi:hypothetical protein